MAFSWIGVGCVNPKVLMERSRPGSMPNSSNKTTESNDLNDKNN
jgi:hypothetical protein